MIKKAIVVLGVLLVGGWLWAKTDLGSYAKTAWREARRAVKQQVPVDFEIKRAKDMLASLNGEEDKLVSAMAKEMVAIEGFEKEIAKTETTLENLGQEVKTANKELKEGRTVLTMGGLEYRNREQFALNLERAFGRYQSMETGLKYKKESLTNHRHALAAAKEQLDALQVAKKELQARIELAELELENIKVAQARSNNVYKFDDSELAKVKSLVDEIEKTIKTEAYEMKLRGDQVRPATTNTPARTAKPELTREIDSYFGAEKADERTTQK
jgi:chromosome segregation ATPase